MNNTLQTFNDRGTLRELVRESQQYERKRAEKARCGQTWVQPLRNGVVLNAIPHSGVVTHICAREPHAGGELCKCECGLHALVK
jgi:hypothetical protein